MASLVRKIPFVLIAVAALINGPADAAVTPERFPSVPVFGGDGVLWAEPLPLGSYVLRSGAPGRPTRERQQFRTERPGDESLSLRVVTAASGSVSLLSSWEFQDLFLPGLRNVYYEQYAGPAGGPLERLARCPGSRETFRSIDVSGDAYVYRQCDDDRGHVEVRDIGAAPSSPSRSVGDGGFGARIAGRYVAWLDGQYSTSSLANGTDIVVYDRVLDREVYRIPNTQLPGLIQSLDLQEDGKVAFAFGPSPSDDDVVLGWASPDEPHVHRLLLPAMDSYDIHMTGDEIAFQRGKAPNYVVQNAAIGITNLAGDARILARHTDDYIGQESFDFDGMRLVWRELGCERPRLVVRDAGAAGSTNGSGPCPLRMKRRPAYKRGVATFFLSCGALAAPCSFHVQLRTTGAKSRRVGQSEPAGSENPIRVRLTRKARKLIARRGSLHLRVSASLFDQDTRNQTRKSTVTLRR